MKELTADQRLELVRREVLAFLAPRQSLSYEPMQILRRVIEAKALDFEPAPEEVSHAIAFLLDRDFIKRAGSKFGRTLYYQATSAGVLAIERGAFEDL